MGHLVTIEANEAAELLLNEVRKVQAQQSGPSTYMPKLTIMILAALNIANNIMQLKRTGEFVNLTSDRLAAIDRRLDEGLMELQGFRQHG